MMQKNEMIYTPQKRIPIGKVIEIDGQFFLEFKNSKFNTVETISISELMRLITKKNDIYLNKAEISQNFWR
ncbi:MAG: hypothetical protein R3Y09_10715 [Clostridia bacterium]